MPEGAQGVGRVVVARSEVHLRADDLCRPRWVRYAVPVPERVVAYRIGERWGLPVAGTPAEAAHIRRHLDKLKEKSGTAVG